MSMLARARPDLAAFRTYVCARDDVDAPIRLNANESPWPSRGSDGCNRYPDPQPSELRTRLADLYGVTADRLWIGRGSDEAIDLLLRVFCRAGRDNVVTFGPTFGMYRVGAQLQGADYRELPLDADRNFALDPARLLALTDANTKLVFVCSPNNPTGTLHHDSLAFLAARLDGRALLVVDEAYIEFANVPSAIGLIDRFENVAVLRTFSKAHALAGARVGALIASEDIAAMIGRIAPPYPLASPSIALALDALRPDALRDMQARVNSLIAERSRVGDELAKLPVVTDVWRSNGNFVLARFVDGSSALECALRAGIVVRDVSVEAGLENCLRITIGSRDENDALLQAFAGRALNERTSARRTNSARQSADAATGTAP